MIAINVMSLIRSAVCLVFISFSIVIFVIFFVGRSGPPLHFLLGNSRCRKLPSFLRKSKAGRFLWVDKSQSHQRPQEVRSFRTGSNYGIGFENQLRPTDKNKRTTASLQHRTSWWNEENEEEIVSSLKINSDLDNNKNALYLEDDKTTVFDEDNLEKDQKRQTQETANF